MTHITYKQLKEIYSLAQDMDFREDLEISIAQSGGSVTLKFFEKGVPVGITCIDDKEQP